MIKVREMREKSFAAGDMVLVHKPGLHNNQVKPGGSLPSGRSGVSGHLF